MTVQPVRVGDVLRLEREPVEPDAAEEYVSIGIRSFGKGIFHYEPKAGDRLGKLRFFAVRPNRLMISNIKAWEGAIAVSTEAEVGCVASNRFMPYAPIDERIDVRWARWFFLSEVGLPMIERASPGSADRNRTLAIERFEELEIPLPPIDDQREISDRLDLIRASTAEVSLRVDRAKRLATALGVSVCARPDLSIDVKANDGWRLCPLGEVMTPAQGRTSVQADRAYPNLGIYSFGRGVFEKPDIDGAVTSATVLNRVQAGQFVYSRLFAFEGAYAYVPPAFDGYFVSNEFPSFDPDPDQLDARWLATYLRSAERWAELAGASKGLGVRRQRIPAESILAYEVWLPPIELQRSMVAAIDAIGRASGAREAIIDRVAAFGPSVLNEVFAALS